MTNKIEWAKVNWDKQDIVISVEAGCSREAVRQARVRLSAGQSDTPRQHRADSAVKRLSKVDTSVMTLPELMKVGKCHTNQVMVALKQLGKDYKRRPRGSPVYDWTKFPQDWAKQTDKEIAILVGANNPAIVTQWRIRHGYIKHKQH